jgi:hypothetical protein
MLLSTVAGAYGLFASDTGTFGKQYAEQYAAAEPFPHIVLDNFLNAEVLDLCLREFPRRENAQAAYNRSQEKRKFEYRPEMLTPSVRTLFYSFNSLPFISFLQNVTGINGLIPDLYFSGGGLHEVLRDGYLKIHTDFNHHDQLDLERRINVLIYLNKGWKEEYGGSLELWDKKMQRRCSSIVPLFNRCVIFSTSSISYHGNPEPVRHPEGVSRRAIALYYYTATWDNSRFSRTTHFRPRPNKGDAFDYRVRASELIESISPPILLRAARKVARLLQRQRSRPIRPETV